MFAETLMGCLGLPYPTVSTSFLSKLPINLFSLALCSDCECFGTHFLNLASSKYRES